MRYPWANIALLLLLTAQLITGFIGFTNGELERKWLLWLHGIGAYAISLLILWKAAIIVSSFRRSRSWGITRISFLLLIILLIAALLSGLIWTISGPRYFLSFSLITIHIFIAAALGGLLLYHIYRYRWIVRHPVAVNRRSFLNLSAVAAAGAAAWFVKNRTIGLIGLPGSKRRFTGSYKIGSFSGSFPSVSWISDRTPQLDTTTWQLIINGAVQHPANYSFHKLLKLDKIDLTAVLDCTGGWYTEQIWRGIRLADLLETVQPTAPIQSLTIRSTTGYNRRFGLDQASDYILAYQAAGQPLKPGNGYPLRLVTPGQRGVNWVKWVSAISLNTTPAFIQSLLPLQ